jgi:hypothetical protein
MTPIRLLVGAKKGAVILTGDARRRVATPRASV